MSSTRLSPSTVSNSSMTTTNNTYPCSPMSTLRRASRPSSIPLPFIDPSHNPNDPTAMLYIKQSHIPHPPSSASFIPQPTYPIHFNNHPPLTALPMSNNHDHHPAYSQPSPQYHHQHHTPRTFPLPHSINNHGHAYFQFPPVLASQSSTPPHRSLPRVDESSSSSTPSWSNPVLNPLMVKRMNETSQTLHHLDDDDDPSASIDALVADEQSNSSEMLDDSHSKSINPSNSHSTTGAISPYRRQTSHVLTTPPNPLASDDHPDNQNFVQSFTPIQSAGFELSSGRDPKTSTYFTFEDPNVSMKYSFNEDKRSMNRMHDDNNSNHSSSNSSTRDVKSVNSHGKHACTYPECIRSFANKSALAKHKLTHSQDRKHKCPTCHKGFKRLDHLSGHMLTHADEKPHKCRVPTCVRTYCDARSLKRHIENTHQEVLRSIFEDGQEQLKTYLPENAVVKPKDITSTNEMPVEGNDGNSPRSFTDSTRNVAVYTYDEEKSVACQICQKMFRSGAALNGHMRLHGGFTEGSVKPSPSEFEKKPKRTPISKRQRIESPSHPPIKLEKLEPVCQPATLATTMKIEPKPGMILDNSSLSRPPSTIPITLPTMTISSEILSRILGPIVKPPITISCVPSTAVPELPVITAKEDKPDPTPTKSDCSSSSSSTDQMFIFDPPESRREPTPNPFVYPSHSIFRRQASLTAASQAQPNSLPTMPYTPPPMLSAFRKGHGLYYRTFSQPGSTEWEIPIVTTPIIDDTTGPKINIGLEYQAAIPKLRTGPCSTDRQDELLFSPDHLPYLDEPILEKFEILHRSNSTLFSPRSSPRTYSFELIYMLLFEYQGDLQRTIQALINGVVDDIPSCRPLHQYRFLESDRWSLDEIEAFANVSQTSERDFGAISRAVRTKTVKQCIEFYYMPKVSSHARRIHGKGISSIITRRKRTEMLKKEHQKRLFNDEDTSSSSFNDSRMDDDSPGDILLVNHYTCDREECGQTFTSDRAWRAHRKEHAPSPTTKTVKFR